MLASVRRTSGPFGLLIEIIRWVLLWLNLFGPIAEVVACSGLAVECPMEDWGAGRAFSRAVAGLVSWTKAATMVAEATKPEPDATFLELAFALADAAAPAVGPILPLWLPGLTPRELMLPPCGRSCTTARLELLCVEVYVK